MRGHAGDVLAVEDQPAEGRIVDARDDVEDRRLAGAVGPDDREDLARLDRERHVGDCPDPAEIHHEPFDCQEAHRSRSDRMYVFWRRNVARL